MSPAAVTCLIIILFFARNFIIGAIPLRLSSKGFKYVHVEIDGSVRELDQEEQSYLMMKFNGADGARPYIKSNYWQTTPDRKLHGFLERSRVPWWIQISEKPTR